MELSIKHINRKLKVYSMKKNLDGQQKFANEREKKIHRETMCRPYMSTAFNVFNIFVIFCVLTESNGI